MKKKTYYTISAIIATIAAIFFGVPALSYKEKRKVINGVPNGVFYQPTTTESFIQYTIRYWKELFVKPLQTANNEIDSLEKTTEKPSNRISPEVAKLIEEALTGTSSDKIYTLQ